LQKTLKKLEATRNSFYTESESWYFEVHTSILGLQFVE